MKDLPRGEYRTSREEAERYKNERDEVYEWYSDAVNEYADEVHEAE